MAAWALWTKRFIEPSKPRITTRTPAVGTFTFIDPYCICLRGTRVEVDITEVMERYYRITPIQVLVLLGSHWTFDWREELPKLVPHNHLEILKWIEPDVIPVVEEKGVVQALRRKIRI